MESNTPGQPIEIPTIIENTQKQDVNQHDKTIYQALAIQLFIDQGKNKTEVQRTLISKGMPEMDAKLLCDKLDDQINSAKRERAQKDMIYGALWCVGGTVATMAHIGFIFWGAIVFGGIQFFKGLINYQSAQ